MKFGYWSENFNLQKVIYVLRFLLWIWIPCLFFARCTGKSNDTIVEISGGTMGTYYQVKYVPSAVSLISDKELAQEIEAVLKRVNDTMSTWLSKSEISKFNTKIFIDGLKIDPWFVQVLQFSLELAKQTSGIYDPTIKPIVALWGFHDGGLSKVPAAEDIAETMKFVGYDKVLLDVKTGIIKKSHSKVQLDLSSTAKGFAVDKLSELLVKYRLENHMIDIGGEVVVSGYRSSGGAKQRWRIAIEAPTSDRIVSEVIEPYNVAIATSGNYRNYFKKNGMKYAHTINPKTGKPVQHNLTSVTVLAETCLKADGYATALMAMGSQAAKKFAEKNNIAALFIEISDKGLISSRNEYFEKAIK